MSTMRPTVQYAQYETVMFVKAYLVHCWAYFFYEICLSVLGGYSKSVAVLFNKRFIRYTIFAIDR